MPSGWVQGAFPFPGVDGAVSDAVVWDDGTGEALYICGAFTIAGEARVSRLARWDGNSWSAVGGGFDNLVLALEVFNDGTGEALYAAGRFADAGGVAVDDVAKWDGLAWSPVGDGTNDTVYDMAVYDDGFGPSLFIGGSFSHVSDRFVGPVARLAGDRWEPLAGGVRGSGRPTVFAMETYNDGLGEALYVGGAFNDAGGASVSNLARWDGAVWSPVGDASSLQGTSGQVRALRSIDLGGGPDLYIGGDFFRGGDAESRSIVRWDGTRWEGLDQGVNERVNTIMLFDAGDGPRVYVGGFFSMTRGTIPVEAMGVAAWDGDQWHAVGDGTGSRQEVGTLVAYDDGDGPELFATGSFTITQGAAGSRLMKWDGSSWRSLRSGLSGPVSATLSVDEPGATALFVGGDFFAVEPALDRYPRYLARWDGQQWSHIGDAFNGPVYALALHDAGDGPQVYAGGTFTMIGDTPANNIARWDGDQWHPLGEGVSGGFPDTHVRALISHDDGSGPALYVGGRFQATGEPGLTELIARWDGERWSRLGPDVTLAGESVFDLEVFDEGDGAMLFACGDFERFESVPARRIGRWDGAEWSSVGGRIDFSADHISALEVFDDGSGPALYAGGDMQSFGDTTVNSIARWDGSAWSALGEGVDDPVLALAVYDDGSGPQLYAGGEFTQADGQPARHAARWDGSAWSAMGEGLNQPATSMVVHDMGDGPTLVIGGGFTLADGRVSNRLALWNGPPPPPCPADLDGDGLLTIFDFLRYQNLFDAGDLAADFDGDGELTIFDFLAFQNAFDAGCA